MNIRIKAETRAQAMEDIRTRRGKLTPTVVRDEARDPKNPLHGDIRWLWDDDREAAERYRLDVAAEMIREITVTISDKDGNQQSIRGYHSLPVGQGRYEYQPLDEILSNAVSRKVLFKQMEREADEMQARYEHLQEFWEMWRTRDRRRAG